MDLNLLPSVSNAESVMPRAILSDVNTFSSRACQVGNMLHSSLMKLQAVKGTYDILPANQAKDVYNNQDQWSYVYVVTARVLSRAGLKELTIPIFEQKEVFVKSVGESSDIVVQNEMYTFADSGGRQLALRPEFTGGVMRAFIEHGMYVQPLPVKLWSRGLLSWTRRDGQSPGRIR